MVPKSLTFEKLAAIALGEIPSLPLLPLLPPPPQAASSNKGIKHNAAHVRWKIISPSSGHQRLGA
jgi:hypothetical protein